MESKMSFDKKTNRNDFFDQIEKEIMELIDPATNEPYEYLVEHIHCPACESKGKFFLKKWGFTYNRCLNCDLIFVSPRLTESNTVELYKKGSKANALWASSVNSSDHQQKFNTEYFKGHLSLLKKYKTHGDLLDIGCGNGHFLKVAQSAGFNVKGVELEENAIVIAKKKGLNVEPLLLTDKSLNSQRFDIITMFGVLEHLFKPARDISIVHSMLNDEGIFMGITPNAQSLVGLLLHEKARFYTPRNHPMIFSSNSIKKLFKTNGFELLHADTVLTGYDSIINNLQYNDPFADLKIDFLPAKLHELVKDKVRFENMIIEWDLGLRLRIIAKKQNF